MGHCENRNPIEISVVSGSLCLLAAIRVLLGFEKINKRMENLYIDIMIFQFSYSKNN